MKTIIAGGRDYQLTEEDEQFLDTLDITEVISGTCRGADKDGEKWAKLRRIPVRRFPPDWVKHNKAAGFIRNVEMAKYAQVLVAFPGGKGTAHMLREAKRLGLVVYDMKKRLNQSEFSIE